jgi:OOP family OmpA-OmpF porin
MGWGIAVLAAAMSAPLAHAELGEDHPQVARFPGALIGHYDFKQYEEFVLLLSKPVNRNSEYVADKVLQLEGQVTYIHYEVPKFVSPLQVFRNYQSALRRSGFTPLFVCERPCTTNNLDSYSKLMKASKHYLNHSTDNQFLAAQRGNTYVSLWVNDGGVWQHVVDKEALNDALMEVRGESPIAKSLSQDGKVDLYGFQFDTGKAVLKDGSRATLQDLGTVLQDNPTLRVEVVGHTDDVGGADANQKLSQARAAAVADALARSHGIDAQRLTVRGMGQTQSLLDNTSETARAKNRRVEIIALLPSTASVAATPTPRAQQGRVGSSPVAPTTPAPVAMDSGAGGSVFDDASKLMDAANKLKGLFGR